MAAAGCVEHVSKKLAVFEICLLRLYFVWSINAFAFLHLGFADVVFFLFFFFGGGGALCK